MPRKILCILSEWRFSGEELVGPLETLDQHGYEVVFATSQGTRLQLLPSSEDPRSIDPLLGHGVISEKNTRTTRELSESSRQAHRRRMLRRHVLGLSLLRRGQPALAPRHVDLRGN